MAVPIDFKKTLAAFAERNSQTKSYTGEVITAPDVDGKCKVRISGSTAQTCLAIGTVNQGDQVMVMRFPGSPYPVAIGSGGTSADTPVQSGLPVTMTSDLVAHTLDGAFHTGSIRNDQAPQFVLLDGSRPFTGDMNAAGNKFINLRAPTSPDDAATKDYVDDAVTNMAHPDH